MEGKARLVFPCAWKDGFMWQTDWGWPLQSTQLTRCSPVLFSLIVCVYWMHLPPLDGKHLEGRNLALRLGSSSQYSARC